MTLVASPLPPSYDSNCQWPGASCADFSSYQSSGGNGNYFVVPSLNLGSLSQSQGFSICTWFVYDQVDSWARIFDFGDGAYVNNIFLAREGTSSTLVLAFYQDVESSFTMISPLPIALGVWRHFCIVNQGYSWVMYDNGAQTASYWASWSTTILPTVLTSNYIGRSNWNGDAMLRGRVADFRIYSQALSPQQVFAIFNRQGVSLRFVSILIQISIVCTWYEWSELFRVRWGVDVKFFVSVFYVSFQKIVFGICSFALNTAFLLFVCIFNLILADFILQALQPALHAISGHIQARKVAIFSLQIAYCFCF